MKGFADAFVESIILKVINNQLSSREAARILHITKRYVNKLKCKYIVFGIQCFKHANSGSESLSKTDPVIENSIINLYSDKYNDFNYTHFLSKLKNDENIFISYKALYRILTDAGFTSPKAQHKKKKLNIHPSRPRRENFGEFLQIDASIHPWFKGYGFKVALHGAIDDATGTVMGLYFDYEETLNGYYHMLEKIITQYGIPQAFYADKRTVFTYERLKDKDKQIENNTNIQFKRCCSQLNIDIITTSIPQAKGKIERLWGTLQSRLLSELALHKITNIEDANKFLPEFEKEFNSEFALPIDNQHNVFKKWDKTIDELYYYLSVQYFRITDSGCSFSLDNTKYQVIDNQSKVLQIPNKTKLSVYKLMDGEIVAVYQGKFYETKVNKYSKVKAVEFTKATKSHWKPSPDHPWRKFVVACG